MKLRRILNEMRNKSSRWIYSDLLYEALEEAFDFKNIQIEPIHQTNRTAYTFEIQINDELMDVYVDFVPMKREDVKLFPLISDAKTIFNVAYSMGDEMLTTQAKRSNFKVFIVIMKTVTECILDFIKSNEPDVLLFFAAGKRNKDLNDIQKMNSYRSIADQHLPGQYAIENFTHQGKEGFLAFNRSRFQGKNWYKKG